MGPCPPVGRHRYMFTLYALDKRLDKLPDGASKSDVLGALVKHVIAEAKLTATYEKTKK